MVSVLLENAAVIQKKNLKKLGKRFLKKSKTKKVKCAPGKCGK